MRRARFRRMARAGATAGGGSSSFMEVGTDGMVTNWNPNPFVDLVFGSNGFIPAGAGIGDPESTSIARDANGWPQASWQLLCYQAGNRPNPSTIKTGVWKVRVTDTAAGNSGVLTATGVSLSNQVRAGQVVTADMTIASSSEPFIAFAYPHAISEFRVVDPDFPINTTRIFNDAARAFGARQYGFRVLNLSGQNSRPVPRSNSWATEVPMQKSHGLRGWGFLADMFVELATAPSSRCKRFGLNAPPKWRHGPGDAADFTSWVTYIRSKTIGVAGSVITWASTNETWNGGTYLHFHWFMQQARNGIINNDVGVGDMAPWWLPDAADLARIQAGTSDQFVHWARWWGLRDVRLANAVKTVYGADFGTRALFNVETHMFNPYWHRDVILPWLSQSAQTTEFGQPNTYFHTLSVAPYISIQADLIPSITSDANALAVMRNGAGNPESMAGCLAQIDTWIGVANTFSLGGLVLYEFNSTHLDPYFDTAQGQYFIDAINSPGSKTLMRDFLDGLNSRGIKYAYALGCWPMTYPPLGGGLSKQNTMWGMTQNYSYSTPPDPSSRDGGYRAAAIDEYLAAHE